MRDEVNKNEGQTPAETGGERAPEWRTADPLLNAPSRLTRLVETTLIASVITGVLYAWGLSYYHAFTEALGLSNYRFAFQVQSQEALIAGAYVMAYIFGAVPVLFGSVSVALMSVVAVVAAAHFAASLLRALWRRSFSQLVLPRRRAPKRAAGQETSYFSPNTERDFERVGRAAENFFVFAVFLFLLLTILRWGEAEAAKFGVEIANRQLAACPKVEVMFGENEKVDSELCGRIGGDYILRAPRGSEGPQDRFIILKEAAVKRIVIH